VTWDVDMRRAVELAEARDILSGTTADPESM
jgi:hypothetical protein